MPLSIGADVKVQDSVFTAGLSGNWNVSYFSIALRLSLVLMGTEWHKLESEELHFLLFLLIGVLFCLFYSLFLLHEGH